MDSDMIKEFLVGLGFKVDSAGLKTFLTTLEGVTRAAVAVGVGVTAAASATVAAVATVSDQFESLYYASQRLRSGVANIQGYGFAIGNLGGTVEGARSSLEGLASFIRSNPGAEKFISSIGQGISTRDANGNLRDTVSLMGDIGKQLKAMPYFRAKIYANLLGIDESTLQAMMRGIDQFKDEYANLYKQAGINADLAAKNSTTFMNALRDMKARVEVLGDVFAIRLAPAAMLFLKAVDGLIWIIEKADQVTLGLSSTLITVAIGLGIASKAAKLLGLDLLMLIGRAIAPLLLQLAVLTASALPALSEALLGIGAAIEGGGILAFGWIAIIIGAIVGLIAIGYELVKHWNQIWDAVASAVKTFGDGIAAILIGLGVVIGGPVGIIVSIISAIGLAAYELIRHWDSIAGFFGGLWGDVKASFTDAAAWISAKVHEMMPGGLTSAWNGIAGFFGGLWGDLEKTFKAGWDRIKPYVQAMAALIKRDWAGAIGAVAGGIVGAVAGGAPGAVAGAVAGGAAGQAANTPQGRKAISDAAKATGQAASYAGRQITGDVGRGNLAGAGMAALDFFKKAGWTAAQAAGIVANIARESAFNPQATGDRGQAIGLGQWHPDRQKAFAAWAGHDIRNSTFQEQLGFINYELTKGSEQAAGRFLRSAQDAFSSGAIVSSRYERPADAAGEAARRGMLAENWYARALAPAGGSKNITVTQNSKAEIHVHGSSSPAETAKVVTREQTRVHGDAVRNLRGALT